MTRVRVWIPYPRNYYDKSDTELRARVIRSGVLRLEHLEGGLVVRTEVYGPGKWTKFEVVEVAP